MRTSGEQAKARRECFKAHHKTDANDRVYMICCFCGGHIYPAIEGWEAAHGIRHSLTADNSPENVKPSHKKCHRETVPDDTKAAAKDVRVFEKNIGIKQKKGFGWRR